MPSRAGGAVVASHIRVATNGPVPDYVHYHRVQFQMIYCVRGWARLVYEDGGPPSIMKAGDCVVQPPTIRHRVLESGDGLEVVEVSCPAEHETMADPDMQLPTEYARSSFLSILFNLFHLIVYFIFIATPSPQGHANAYGIPHHLCSCCR